MDILSSKQQIFPTGELNVLRKETARFSFTAEVKGKECYACGYRRHLRKSPQCPAKNQFCKVCGKRGHFRDKCRNVQASTPSTSRLSMNGYRSPPRRKTNANLIEEDVQEKVEEKTSNFFPLIRYRSTCRRSHCKSSRGSKSSNRFRYGVQSGG